jgi:chromosome segregation ATPase
LASDEPQASTVLQHFHRLRALLSSPIETLVEDSAEVQAILEEIKHQLPVALQVKLWPVVTTELVVLRQELEALEERVRLVKQLIHDKETLMARSQEEAEGIRAQLKAGLAEIRALDKQLVAGKDEDDEAEIAEVDRVRADALTALEAFLQ